MRRTESTRRKFLEASAAIGSTVIAGCMSGSPTNSGQGSDSNTSLTPNQGNSGTNTPTPNEELGEKKKQLYCWYQADRRCHVRGAS